MALKPGPVRAYHLLVDGETSIFSSNSFKRFNTDGWFAYLRFSLSSCWPVPLQSLRISRVISFIRRASGGSGTSPRTWSQPSRRSTYLATSAGSRSAPAFAEPKTRQETMTAAFNTIFIIKPLCRTSADHHGRCVCIGRRRSVLRRAASRTIYLKCAVHEASCARAQPINPALESAAPPGTDTTSPPGRQSPHRSAAPARTTSFARYSR